MTRVLLIALFIVVFSFVSEAVKTDEGVVGAVSIYEGFIGIVVICAFVYCVCRYVGKVFTRLSFCPYSRRQFPNGYTEI